MGGYLKTANKQIQLFLNKLTVFDAYTRREITDHLPKRCSVVFRNVLYKNIASQKYKYPELSKKYKKEKIKKGVYNLGFWRYTSSLFGRLKSFKDPYGRGWVAGIMPNTKNKEGDDITTYGLANEKLRPLFEPSTKDFAENEYKKVARMSLSKLLRIWKS